MKSENLLAFSRTLVTLVGPAGAGPKAGGAGTRVGGAGGDGTMGDAGAATGWARVVVEWRKKNKRKKTKRRGYRD